MSSPSLSSLPAVSFAPLNAQDVEQEIITTYERIAETSLYPGDPVRLLLESLAYTISIQSGLIDLAAKQNLLAFATGRTSIISGHSWARRGWRLPARGQRFVFPSVRHWPFRC